MKKKIIKNIQNKLKHLAITGVLIILSSFQAISQDYYMEAGFPFLQNFSSKEYGAHSQNFAIAQDHRGVMYFGNFSGILEYDGSNWNTILTSNISKVSALATDDKGRIYVGARGEFGYLQPDELGNMVFFSLMFHDNTYNKEFGDVNYVYTQKDKVFFITKNYIFIYNQQNIQVIESENDIISAFYVDNILFCQLHDKGLCQLQNKEFKTVRDGDIFAGAIYLSSIIKHHKNQYLLASDIQGLFLMDDSGIKPFNTDAQSYLKNNQLSCGLKLNDGSYAFGTKRGGIVNIYADGSLKQVLSKKAGLQNEYINSLFSTENGIWLALNNGLSRIETPSPLSFHDENSGLIGGVLDMVRYKSQLYVATYNGLYYQDQSTALFKNIPEVSAACWSILVIDDYLLAATSNGLFKISDGQIQQLSNKFCLSIYHYKKNNDLLFVGTNNGIIIFQKDGSNWHEKEGISGINNEIREIGEDIDGILWFVTTVNGVISYEPKSKQFQSFNKNDSLPSKFGNHICMLNNKLILSTMKGLYKYDNRSKLFMKYKVSGSDSSFSNHWFYKIFQDENKNIWTINGDETNLCIHEKTNGNILKKNQVPFMQISDFVVWDMLFDENGVAWFGGSDGLIRYENTANNNYKKSFRTLIRSVVTTNDSVLFGGSTLNQKQYNIPQLNSGSNMRFKYTALSYNYKEELQYQYYLEGFSDLWSDWTSLTQKEYTNLAGGRYIFHIKAKDIYNNISEEANFEFTITTPWYLKWWAYIIYLVLLTGLIYLIVVWRAQELVKEKKELENIVKERTAEIVEKKEEIEKQSLGIAQKNAELEKINFIVKSINSEINLTNMLISILEKTKVIKGVEKATALLNDEKTKSFKFKASYGWDLEAMGLTGMELSQNEAEQRYIRGTEEIFEDIFYAKEVKYSKHVEDLDKLVKPKSMLVLVLKIESQVEGFLLLENMHITDAFTENDLSLIKNLKEHIISAFIRAKILEDLKNTLHHLKETQEELIRQEKLASVGKLTKGIVDRVINPLNYINNFSALSSELIEELNEALQEEKGNIKEESYEDLKEIFSILDGNMGKIKSHGTNAAHIIKAMESLLKDKSYNFITTEINTLLQKKTELVIKESSVKFNYNDVKLNTNYSERAGLISVMHEEFEQVIYSLIDNAFYVLIEKTKTDPDFNPEITLKTKKLKSDVEIRITDNGSGIPKAEIKKIFDPFFTTKPTSSGTGIGLYKCMDIIHTHNGDLKVESDEGKSTTFVITLPSAKSVKQ